MPSPLFKNTAKALQAAARREFQSTTLGKLVGEVDSVVSGRATQAKMERLARQAKRVSRGGALGELARRNDYAEMAQGVSKYAKGALKDQLLNALFEAAGPVGGIIKALFRPSRQRLATVERELSAAADLLTAFGFSVSPTKPGRPSRMADPRDAAAQAQQLLESLGYTVTAPDAQKAPPQAPRERQAPQRSKPPRQRPRATDKITIKLGGRIRHLSPNDPIVSQEMVMVQSSNVHSIGIRLDPSGLGDSHILLVRFLADGGGPGSLYEYFGIPIKLWDSFMLARSKGTFVWDHIRIRGTISGHKYQYDLAGISGGYVPRRAKLIGDEEWFVKRRFRSQVQDRESQLDDQLVRRLPNRGKPNRGTPNRGR